MTRAAFLASVVRRCLVRMARAAEAASRCQRRDDRGCVARVAALMCHFRLVLNARRVEPVTRQAVPRGCVVIDMASLARCRRWGGREGDWRRMAFGARPRDVQRVLELHRTRLCLSARDRHCDRRVLGCAVRFSTMARRASCGGLWLMVARLASNRPRNRQATVLRAAPVAGEARDLRVPCVRETVPGNRGRRGIHDRLRDVWRSARREGGRDKRRDRGQGPTDGARRQCDCHRCQPGRQDYLGESFRTDMVAEGVGGVTRTER